MAVPVPDDRLNTESGPSAGLHFALSGAQVPVGLHVRNGGNPNLRVFEGEDLCGAILFANERYNQADYSKSEGLRGVELTDYSITEDLRGVQKSFGFTQKFYEILDGCLNPYHNADHTERVLRCFVILSQYSDLLEPHERNLADHLKEEIKQERVMLGCLAALAHDLYHCGERYRQGSSLATATDRIIPEELKTVITPNMSNEEVSAVMADWYFKDHLSLRQRIILRGLILSTAFGQLADCKDIADRPELIRPYQPTTTLERALCAADTGAAFLGVHEHIENSLALLKENIAAGAPKPQFDEWLEGDRSFRDNVISKKLEAMIEDGTLVDSGGNLKRSLNAIQEYTKSDTGRAAIKAKFERQFEDATEPYETVA